MWVITGKVVNVTEHISLKYIASYLGNKYAYLQRKLRLWCQQHVAGTAGCLTNSSPPDFLFSQALVRVGGMGVSLPHVTQWRVTFPYSGSKGNPAFLSQSQGPFPHAGAGVGTGVLDGLSSLLSLGSKLPWSHCLCLFQRIAHKRYSGQKDGVIPLGLAGAMPVSR